MRGLTRVSLVFLCLGLFPLSGFAARGDRENGDRRPKTRREAPPAQKANPNSLCPVSSTINNIEFQQCHARIKELRGPIFDAIKKARAQLNEVADLRTTAAREKSGTDDCSSVAAAAIDSNDAGTKTLREAQFALSRLLKRTSQFKSHFERQLRALSLHLKKAPDYLLSLCGKIEPRGQQVEAIAAEHCEGWKLSDNYMGALTQWQESAVAGQAQLRLLNDQVRSGVKVSCTSLTSALDGFRADEKKLEGTAAPDRGASPRREDELMGERKMKPENFGDPDMSCFHSMGTSCDKKDAGTKVDAGGAAREKYFVREKEKDGKKEYEFVYQAKVGDKTYTYTTPIDKDSYDSYTADEQLAKNTGRAWVQDNPGLFRLEGVEDRSAMTDLQNPGKGVDDTTGAAATPPASGDPKSPAAPPPTDGKTADTSPKTKSYESRLSEFEAGEPPKAGELDPKDQPKRMATSTVPSGDYTVKASDGRSITADQVAAIIKSDMIRDHGKASAEKILSDDDRLKIAQVIVDEANKKEGWTFEEKREYIASKLARVHTETMFKPQPGPWVDVGGVKTRAYGLAQILPGTAAIVLDSPEGSALRQQGWTDPNACLKDVYCSMRLSVAVDSWHERVYNIDARKNPYILHAYYVAGNGAPYTFGAAKQYEKDDVRWMQTLQYGDKRYGASGVKADAYGYVFLNYVKTGDYNVRLGGEQNPLQRYMIYNPRAPRLDHQWTVGRNLASL